jgi:DNA-binding response OmpR family regulator
MENIFKIFIAEDDTTLAEIYIERFKRAHFEVKHFPDGLKLLENLASETPDVVLLDINMPEMDGFEVLRAIHANFQDKSKQDVLVIVWSNLSSEADIKKTHEMGASMFLKKVDYSGDDLVQKVKLAVESAKRK